MAVRKPPLRRVWKTAPHPALAGHRPRLPGSCSLLFSLTVPPIHLFFVARRPSSGIPPSIHLPPSPWPFVICVTYAVCSSFLSPKIPPFSPTLSLFPRVVQSRALYSSSRDCGSFYFSFLFRVAVFFFARLSRRPRPLHTRLSIFRVRIAPLKGNARC